MIGEINDFAGSDMNMDVAAAPQVGIGQNAGALSAHGGAIPVVITGTRPPITSNFPGLRDAMIGAAVFQLAEQLSPDNKFKEAIKALAMQLHQSGGEKIARGVPKPRNGGKKPRK